MSFILFPLMSCVSAKAGVRLLVVLAALAPQMLYGQDRVIIVRHESTPQGDVIRAEADAALLLKQAELIGEKANAQRLENMMRECDVAQKRMITRNKTKGTLESKFEHTFDVIRFNQQLADIRSELEQKALMRRTRIGDPTEEMNSLLEKFARHSIDAGRIPAMKTELTPEQLDAIFLTDGANTFSGKTGKTKLEAFKWPFLIQRKDFQEERAIFDAQCDKVVKDIDANGSPSPETIMDLLEKAAAIGKKIDAIPLSDNPDVRSVETKWRREAKAFIRELTQTLGNCSKLDSEKLSKYAFRGKTLGELIGHLDSKGLRFSHPGQQDANLYASVFFVMRYAYQEYEKDPNGTAGIASNDARPTASSSPTETPQKAKRSEDPKSPDTSVKDNRSRSQWVDTTYKRTIYHVKSDQWIQKENVDGKVVHSLTEVARTREYLELKLAKEDVVVRLYANNALFMRTNMKDAKWKWWANGHWEASSK